jgi:MFS superfamily sulfate permease-like transporter
MNERPDRDERVILASNERIKLRATFLNGLAIAIFAVGGLAPVVTALGAMTTPPPPLMMLTTICLPIVYVLHSYAMRSLKDLKP